jgi:ferredoxin
MEVQYDREACSGWFQCVPEWDAFGINMTDQKADLSNSELVDGVFVREVPAEFEEHALRAAEQCPVDAIKIFDDGDQLYP